MKVQQEEEEPSLSCQLISLSYAIYHDLSLHISYHCVFSTLLILVALYEVDNYLLFFNSYLLSDIF